MVAEKTYTPTSKAAGGIANGRSDTTSKRQSSTMAIPKAMLGGGGWDLDQELAYGTNQEDEMFSVADLVDKDKRGLVIDGENIQELQEMVDKVIYDEMVKVPAKKANDRNAEFFNYAPLFIFPSNKQYTKRKDFGRWTSQWFSCRLYFLRRALHTFMFNKHMDSIMLVLILGSSLCLALEDPTNENAGINQQLKVVDYVFTGLFAGELVIKVVVMGLVGHPHAYLRDPWCILDATCVVASVVSMLSAGFGTFRMLRTLRVLRPLRAIKRAEGLRLVIEALMASVSAVFNVTVMTAILIFMFGNVGVRLFKGKFWSCTDASMSNEAECQGAFLHFPDNNFATPPQVMDRVWTNKFFNYDNIGRAMLTLLATATTEGWVAIMHDSVDATSIGSGPIRDNHPHAWFFYLFFMVVVGFYFLNIFVADVIVMFSEEAERKYVSTGLNKNQRQCIEFVLDARPEAKFQAVYRAQNRMLDLVEHAFFETFIMLSILLNTIVMLMQYKDMNDGYAGVLDTFNLVFTSIFIAEATVKLVAYNSTCYFADNWNVLDFVIVIGSVVDIVMGGEGVSVGFLRMFRVARIAKLVTGNDEMRQLLGTFVQAFRSLPYVLLLMCLIYFIFAVIGMESFGKIEIPEDDENSVLDKYVNFRYV